MNIFCVRHCRVGPHKSVFHLAPNLQTHALGSQALVSRPLLYCNRSVLVALKYAIYQERDVRVK